MKSESTIDRLISADVLVSTKDGELTFTEVFQSDLAEQQHIVENQEDELDRTDSEHDVRDTEFDEICQTHLDIVREHSDFWTLCTVLKGYLPSESAERIVQVACVLDQIRSGFPPDEGTPEGFFPVHANRLPVLLPFQERAIVYVWRHDCPPCDTMRERLEEALTDRPENIALFSVYGPADAELLYSEYAIEGGPTTLFVVEGQVDARLFGPHYTNVISNEIQTLYELS